MYANKGYNIFDSRGKIMSQIIINGHDCHINLDKILNDNNIKKFLLVCDSSFKYLKIKDYFYSLKIPFVIFDQFTSNPLYEDVCKGVTLFIQENCDAIVAIGGGSTIDVAKCIKLFCKMKPEINILIRNLLIIK
jgi:alcohol dehydrogenase class IV